MITLKLDAFQAALLAQDVPRDHMAVICPMCKTPQSAFDLIRAGAGATMEEVEGQRGFSCVGRFTGGKGPRREPDGNPCDWTLGGFLKLHELEVERADGTREPFFMPASPEQAQQLMRGNLRAAAARTSGA
jgi:hypothetical protein